MAELFTFSFGRAVVYCGIDAVLSTKESYTILCVTRTNKKSKVHTVLHILPASFDARFESSGKSVFDLATRVPFEHSDWREGESVTMAPQGLLKSLIDRYIGAGPVVLELRTPRPSSGRALRLEQKKNIKKVKS